MKFTGFWEATTVSDSPDIPPAIELYTTINYWPADVLLERLRMRLEELPPGTHIRLDLIAWDEE